MKTDWDGIEKCAKTQNDMSELCRAVLELQKLIAERDAYIVKLESDLVRSTVTKWRC